jgi:hypothetical protein
MGEAKRRKKLLGEKYGTPEYSGKEASLLTPAKIYEDFLENPKLGRWIPLLWVFVKDNWSPDFLADLADLSENWQTLVPILSSVNNWIADFDINRNDYPLTLKEAIQKLEPYGEEVGFCLTFIAEGLNTKGCAFKINFKECDIDKDTDRLAVFYILSLAIYNFHSTGSPASKAA